MRASRWHSLCRLSGRQDRDELADVRPKGWGFRSVRGGGCGSVYGCFGFNTAVIQEETMGNKRLGFVGLGVSLIVALSACGGGSSTQSSSGKIVAHPISWLISRPADASVISVRQRLAADYSTTHPGLQLNLITTPDRPSLLPKY